MTATQPSGRAGRTILATSSAGSGTLTSRVRACTRSNEPEASPVRLEFSCRDLQTGKATPGGELGRHRGVRRVSIEAGNPTAR